MLKPFAIVAACLFLSSCAGTYHSYIDTIKLALADTPDAELSIDEVLSSKSDLLYVTHGERSQAAMALMFIEAGQHKWVSADDALLVMEQGRIVRTLGFGRDLLYLTNTAADPVARYNTINAQSSWLRLADWQHGEYGYPLKSRFELMPGQQLSFFNSMLNTTLVVEYVTYQAEPNYVRFDGQWKNYFWFDTASGALLKSEQTLAPFREPVSMTYISRIARLVRDGSSGVTNND
ncbi:YjbF family lipoprotein [Rheinheimera sp. NSM]|uniref:YjbF family lipoprotein n=1 Tax=Rheinheimera sp. NSM TaxID=3457884 RepID=UPI004036ECAD